MRIKEAVEMLEEGEMLVVFIDGEVLRGCDDADDEEGWVVVPKVRVEQVKREGKVSFTAFKRGKDGVCRRDLSAKPV